MYDISMIFINLWILFGTSIAVWTLEKIRNDQVDLSDFDLEGGEVDKQSVLLCMITIICVLVWPIFAIPTQQK